MGKYTLYSMFQNCNGSTATFYKFYNNKIKYIFRVGVMYSGEYDVNLVCNLTLSVFPNWASLTNMPGHSRN